MRKYLFIFTLFVFGLGVSVYAQGITNVPPDSSKKVSGSIEGGIAPTILEPGTEGRTQDEPDFYEFFSDHGIIYTGAETFVETMFRGGDSCKVFWSEPLNIFFPNKVGNKTSDNLVKGSWHRTYTQSSKLSIMRNWGTVKKVTSDSEKNSLPKLLFTTIAVDGDSISFFCVKGRGYDSYAPLTVRGRNDEGKRVWFLEVFWGSKKCVAYLTSNNRPVLQTLVYITE